MKKINPFANSSRNAKLINYRESLIFSSQKPPRRLLKLIKPHSGRNNQGKITVRHQGGRHKRKYRFIDRMAKGSFDRPYRKDGIKGKIISIEYDPNRNCFISLVNYEDGDFSFIITPEGITKKSLETHQTDQKLIVISGKSANIPIKVGNNLPLRYIPKGIPIHNLELRPGEGGKLIRSSGTYAEITGKEENNKYVLVKLPSKEIRRILADCRATIGKVNNSGANLVKLGKAGRSR